MNNHHELNHITQGDRPCTECKHYRGDGICGVFEVDWFAENKSAPFQRHPYNATVMTFCGKNGELFDPLIGALIK
jgi:hypothetical protein